MEYKIFGIMFFFTVFSFCGCNKLFPDKKLTIQRVPYTGNELRIDGYYYSLQQGQVIIYFLYRNGILLYGYTYPFEELNVIEKEMITHYESMKKSKSNWGVFIIKDNIIEYNQWSVSSGIGGGLPSVECKGIINNDTTFCITETYYSLTGKTGYREEIYHFRQFSPKPDSTNQWIK